MSQIQRVAFVKCPNRLAATYFDRFFCELADGANVVRMAFRAPVHLPELRTEIELQRDVIVTLRRDSGNAAAAAYGVEWAPADGGFFPRLRGTLSTRCDEDRDGFLLELRGYYEPPANFTQPAFEPRIGYRIAQATARDFLARIVAFIETSFRAGEAREATTPQAPRNGNA